MLYYNLVVNVSAVEWSGEEYQLKNQEGDVMIKIIFSDMDGSLLDENGQLPQEFDATIAKLKDRGVIFAPSSGRQYFSLCKTFNKYKDDFLFIAENGTLVMYKDKELFSSPMDRKTALEIIKVGDNFDNILRVYCGKKHSYILESDNRQEYIAEVNKYVSRYEIVKSFSDIDDEPIKMSFFNMVGKSEENIYPAIKEKFGKTMQVVLASDFWTDVINMSVSKGVAVQNVQKILGVTPDECAAFGDYLNDVQMLQAVTHSFAMANAHPDLKQLAKYETVSNVEHGVIVGINKLIEQGLI